MLQHSPLTCPPLYPCLPLLETSLPSCVGLLFPPSSGDGVCSQHSGPLQSPTALLLTQSPLPSHCCLLTPEPCTCAGICSPSPRCAVFHLIICLIRSYTLASAFLASLSLGTIAGSLGSRPMPASLWILAVIETFQPFPQLSAPQPLCDLGSLPLHNHPGTTPFCLPTQLRVLCDASFQHCFPIPMGALISAFLQQVWKSPISGESLPPLCILPTCSCTTEHCVTGASEFVIPDCRWGSPLLLVTTWNLGIMSGAPAAILGHLATEKLRPYAKQSAAER